MIKKFVILILLVAVQSTKIFSQQSNIVKDYYLRLQEGTSMQQFQIEFAEKHLQTCHVKSFTQPFGNKRIGNFSSYYRVSFEGKNQQEIEESLRKCKCVQRYEAQINYSFYHTPNDPKYIYPDTMWHLYKINAAGAWDYSRGSDSVVMAIVDDNVEIPHPDLQPNIYTNPREIENDGLDNDSNGVVDDIHGADVTNQTGNPYTTDSNYTHGTKVAGLADARCNNATGIAGVAYSCKLLSVKCTNNYLGVTHGIEGLFYAASMPDVKVVNVSWGDSNYSQLMQEIIDSAMIYKQNKIVFVAAAGNIGDTTRNYPAACNYVISVSGSDKSDNKVSSSSYGAWVDVAAPGISMYTTKIHGKYGKKEEDGVFIIAGTSFASPLVAGAAALMFSIDTNLTYSEIEHCIVSTGDTMNANFPTCNCPVGKRLNLSKAINCICANHTCWLSADEKQIKHEASFSYYNNNIKVSDELKGKFILQIFATSGQCLYQQAVQASDNISLQKLPEGLYLVNMSNERSISQQKIVIMLH
jgi:subtilisin family serine protease